MSTELQQQINDYMRVSDGLLELLKLEVKTLKSQLENKQMLIDNLKQQLVEVKGGD